jgi:hypothetical protein
MRIAQSEGKDSGPGPLDLSTPQICLSAGQFEILIMEGALLMASNGKTDTRFTSPSFTDKTDLLNRTCYNCQNMYPDMVRFCPQDGADLDYVAPPIEDLARDFAPRRSRLGAAFLAGISVLLLFMLSGWFFTHQAKSGQIAIRTNPPGAVIYLDGSQVGITPVLLMEVPTGVHYLSAEFPGYRNERARIEILPSTKKRLELRLAPLAAKRINPFIATMIPTLGRY